jgi:hypothetical protein
MTYGAETWTPTARLVHKFNAQRAMERAMLGVSLRDRIRSQMSQMILEWRPRLGKRSVGRPQASWSDDLRGTRNSKPIGFESDGRPSLFRIDRVHQMETSLSHALLVLLILSLWLFPSSDTFHKEFVPS